MSFFAVVSGVYRCNCKAWDGSCCHNKNGLPGLDKSVCGVIVSLFAVVSSSISSRNESFEIRFKIVSFSCFSRDEAANKFFSKNTLFAL